MKNKLILLIAFLCTCAFAACEGDGDADYGFGKVYMPQAVSTGGLNNSYAVPSGGGDYTYNFRVENGTVRIILGVIRSGKLSDKKGYTVDVYTSAEDTAAAVSAFGGEAMPFDGRGARRENRWDILPRYSRAGDFEERIRRQETGAFRRNPESVGIRTFRCGDQNRRYRECRCPEGLALNILTCENDMPLVGEAYRFSKS